MKKLFLKMIVLILIAANVFMVSGCWNYREIDEMEIILGAAIDYDEKSNKVILTAEYVKRSGGGEGEVGPEVVKTEGENVFDAVRNLVIKTGRKALWSHTKVLIISEDVARRKEQLISIMDWVQRLTETRDDIWILLSKEKTAGEILEMGIEAQKMVSMDLTDLLKNEGSISKFHAVPIWQFIDRIAADGISPTIPTVHKTLTEYKTMSEIFGTGVFNKTKLVGWLNGAETMSYLWVIGKLKGGILVLQGNDSNETGKMSLEIQKNRTKRKVNYSEGEITMQLDIKTTVRIAEIGGEVNYMDESATEKLENDAAELIQKRVDDVITKVQQAYHSDIFGFAGVVERELPDEWEKIKRDWDQVFTDLKTDINVEVEIRESALKSKPIKVGE